MKPTESLAEEHRAICLVTGAAEREAAFIRENRSVHADTVAAIVEFIRNFADGCHHAKEEDLLFAKLRERGLSDESGPLAVMLAEHVGGRKRTQAIADSLPAARAGDARALDVVADNLDGYCRLLRGHMAKENLVLFPLADRLLSDDDQAWLAAEFARVEREDTGADEHAKYEELAHRLAEGLDLTC